MRAGDHSMKNLTLKRPRWRAPIRESVELARQLRRDSTPAEKILWEHLRDRRLARLKFRRQHARGGFILDFYNAEHRLAVELDGGVHAQQVEYDAQRTEALREHGIRVLRFANDEVERDLESVLKKIVEACR